MTHPDGQDGARPLLLIHAGAGVGPPSSMTPARHAAVHETLHDILAEGERLLMEGAHALDVVERAVVRLEDSPLFNAGRGGALTSEGTIEHDAAIMDGRDRIAGAVAASRRVRNPVRAARAVMEKSPHVMLGGDGVELFARQHGLELVPQWHFFTPERQAALARVQARVGAEAELSQQDVHGTVGAVAIDRNGDLAAATSTGGHANKLPGRIGDTPVIGAGTYADNRFCAISGTGSGEHFMRLVLAHRIACRIELAGEPIARAVTTALAELQEIGGSGGVIAVGPAGTPVSAFTGDGMHRGYVTPGKPAEVAIFRDDPFSPDQPDHQPTAWPSFPGSDPAR